MAKVRVVLTVGGRVQGVSFRRHIQRQARALGVAGWVKNRPDGTVQACLEGAGKNVETLLTWCWFGPDGAEVTSLTSEHRPFTGEFGGFTVL